MSAKLEFWCPNCKAEKWFLPTGAPEKNLYTCVGCILPFELRGDELVVSPETYRASAGPVRRRRGGKVAHQLCFPWRQMAPKNQRELPAESPPGGELG